jgi:hypothetical protein
MTVYLLLEELNGRPPGGEAELAVSGVFATEDAANAACEDLKATARANGEMVYDDGDDWTIEYRVEAHEVRP